MSESNDRSESTNGNSQKVIQLNKAFEKRNRKPEGPADPKIPMPWQPYEIEELANFYVEGQRQNFIKRARQDTRNYEFAYEASLDETDQKQIVAILSVKEQGDDCFYQAVFPKIEGIANADTEIEWTTDDFEKLLKKVRLELNNRFGQTFFVKKAHVAKFPTPSET